jgi:hypothetical protein
LSQKCPYCGKKFKRLSAHKCPNAPTEEKTDKVSPEILKKKPSEKPGPVKVIVPKPAKKSKEVSKIKDLINKTQAETNIGLVGHVDHGIKQSFRHFP